MSILPEKKSINPKPIKKMGDIVVDKMIDIPIFIGSNLYSYPIPTLIVMYHILPTEIWRVIFPRVMYYLPRIIL